MGRTMSNRDDRPVEVITGVQRRRQWTAEQKLAMMKQTFEPGMSVSYTARQMGVAASQLFNWRKAYTDGSLAAVAADEQVVGDLNILGRQLFLVTLAGLTNTKCQAGQSDTDTFELDCLLRHLTPARWLHHFFARASCTISALRRSSAYIFFSRRLSSSSSRIRTISDTSMPPNLLRLL